MPSMVKRMPPSAVPIPIANVRARRPSSAVPRRSRGRGCAGAEGMDGTRSPVASRVAMVSVSALRACRSSAVPTPTRAEDPAHRTRTRRRSSGSTHRPIPTAGSPGRSRAGTRYRRNRHRPRPAARDAPRPSGGHREAWGCVGRLNQLHPDVLVAYASHPHHVASVVGRRLELAGAADGRDEEVGPVAGRARTTSSTSRGRASRPESMPRTWTRCPSRRSCRYLAAHALTTRHRSRSPGRAVRTGRT